MEKVPLLANNLNYVHKRNKRKWRYFYIAFVSAEFASSRVRQTATLIDCHACQVSYDRRTAHEKTESSVHFKKPCLTLCRFVANFR